MSDNNTKQKGDQEGGQQKGQPFVAKTRVKLDGVRYMPGDELPALTKAQIAELQASGAI